MSVRSTLTRGSALVAAGIAIVLALSACGSSSDPLASSTTAASAGGSGAAASGSAGADGPIVIGSANFPESALIANIYQAALKTKGVEASTQLNIGSREIYLKALEDGSISLVPEYTGVLLNYFNTAAGTPAPANPPVSSDDVYTALLAATPSGLKVLAKSPAEDKDAIVVTKEFADTNKLTSIGDLAPIQGEVVIAGPPEFQTRITGLPGLASIYGLPETAWKEFKPLDPSGTLTLTSLTGGTVQAANMFTTDPAIPANNLVALEDPKNMFAAQNVVPLISAAKVNDNVTAALDAVSAKLDTATLTDLLVKVVTNKQDSAQVAQEWVAQNIPG